MSNQTIQETGTSTHEPFWHHLYCLHTFIVCIVYIHLLYIYISGWSPWVTRPCSNMVDEINKLVRPSKILNHHNCCMILHHVCCINTDASYTYECVESARSPIDGHTNGHSCNSAKICRSDPVPTSNTLLSGNVGYLLNLDDHC